MPDAPDRGTQPLLDLAFPSVQLVESVVRVELIEKEFEVFPRDQYQVGEPLVVE